MLDNSMLDNSMMDNSMPDDISNSMQYAGLLSSSFE